MSTLVLRAGVQKLEYWLLERPSVPAGLHGTVSDYRSDVDETDSADTALVQIRQRLVENASAAVEDIVIVAPFGGSEFSAPAPANDENLARLRTIANQAPLHLPITIELARSCRTAFPYAPVTLVFQTAFFVSLPAREALYALPANVGRSIRRYGYHGLYHQAACWRARQLADGRKPGRILSICLEPRPEISAIIGHRPVMVTGGATPLEGLCGEKSCGELDPSAVLALARKLHWGPEQIDLVLTRRSGLLGMTGRAITIRELFASDDDDPRLKLARQVLEHQVLRACGAGIAAMGGVDAMIFSGRYCGLGRKLGPWLRRRLNLKDTDGRAAAISCATVSAGMEQIAAELAATSAAKLRW